MLTNLSASATREVIEVIGAPVFVVSVEAEGGFRFVAVNARLERRTGLSDAALRGRAPHEVLPPDLADRLCARLTQCVEHARPLDYEGHMDREGERQHFEVTLTPLVDGAAAITGIMAVVQDVTEVRRAEKRLSGTLARERELFRRLAGLSSDWFWMTDAMGRLSPFDPDGSSDSSVVDMETAGQTWRSLWDPRLPLEDLPALEAAVAGRRSFRDLIYPQRLKDGRARVVRVSGVPRFDPDGGFAGYVGVCTDITERRNDQRAQAERQKREALGQLAGGLAHELNNLLQPVVSLSGRAGRLVEPAGAAAEMLADINAAAKAARDVVRGVMNFSGRGVADSKPVVLSAAVRQAVDMAAGMLPSDLYIERAIEDLPDTAEVQSADVAQVVVNLLTNAADAVRQGGGSMLTVSLAAAAQNGRRVAVLRVRDDGPGMDAATRESVFDPFFTTKPVGQGSGLGLSVVHGIARGWGGDVKVISAPGDGAAFEVIVPLVADARDMERQARDMAG